MAKCVACMSKQAKELLHENFRDKAMEEALESIPDCKPHVIIEFCPDRPGTKRARSEYQSFISRCMKAKNIKGFGNAAPALKECAAEWRENK